MSGLDWPSATYAMVSNATDKDFTTLPTPYGGYTKDQLIEKSTKPL
jgi:hypothetical protein